MMALDLDRVRRALRDPPAMQIPADEETRRASVSAILRLERGDLEVLLIRRAERAGDPWSGHMAFPGGRRDDVDADPRATAVRETREEVGIDLEIGGEMIGRLDDVIPGDSRGLVTRLVVSPFVWWLRERPELVPNGVEVDEIHWAPIAPLLRGERDTTYAYDYRGQTIHFPAYRIGAPDAERIVWGMTHRMLESLFTRLRAVL
jgi:8-oxo-dGTP pyrophosphatase MutT (NUDIX family)